MFFVIYFVMRKVGLNVGYLLVEMFEFWLVLIMIFLFLISSFMCGLVIGEMCKGNVKMLMIYLIIILIFGVGFVGFEFYEFVYYVIEGVIM